MTHIVSEVTAYDRKRWKVTLDEGAVTFLLYRGEMKQAGLEPPRESVTGAPDRFVFLSGSGKQLILPGTGQTAEPESPGSEGVSQSRKSADGLRFEEGLQLGEEQLRVIYENILLPRAKKRALYYLKNGDKTGFQIRKKLEEGQYPEEIIDRVLEFLKHYRLADDARYTENYVNELKGVKSRREIEAKLYAKGLKGDAVREALSRLPAEDEYDAAEKALAKHNTGDRQKDYAYLARRGFSYDAIEHAFNSLGGEI